MYIWKICIPTKTKSFQKKFRAEKNRVITFVTTLRALDGLAPSKAFNYFFTTISE